MNRDGAALSIAIVGYGRMGRLIDRVATARGHRISARIDPSAPDAEHRRVDAASLAGADTVIEFGVGAGVADNVRAYRAADLRVVLGTTGWSAQREVVVADLGAMDAPAVIGDNFSVGAALFRRLAADAAALAAAAGEYDVALHEIHHRNKLDSPSGTARSVAEAVLAATPAKRRVQVEAVHRGIEPEELHVTSTRVGSTPGTHTLYIDSNADTIEVVHRARNRDGFAIGAVRAAEWLVGKRGVFDVADVFADLFPGRV